MASASGSHPFLVERPHEFAQRVLQAFGGLAVVRGEIVAQPGGERQARLPSRSPERLLPPDVVERQDERRAEGALQVVVHGGLSRPPLRQALVERRDALGAQVAQNILRHIGQQVRQHVAHDHGSGGPRWPGQGIAYRLYQSEQLVHTMPPGC